MTSGFTRKSWSGDRLVGVCDLWLFFGGGGRGGGEKVGISWGVLGRAEGKSPMIISGSPYIICCSWDALSKLMGLGRCKLMGLWKSTTCGATPSQSRSQSASSAQPKLSWKPRPMEGSQRFSCHFWLPRKATFTTGRAVDWLTPSWTQDCCGSHPLAWQGPDPVWSAWNSEAVTTEKPTKTSKKKHEVWLFFWKKSFILCSHRKHPCV